MSKKKACLNPNCSDYKKTKYKAAEKVCPHCQEMLEFVCAQKGCYKVIPEDQKGKHCMIHQAEIDDTRAEIWNGVKTIGSAALTIGLSFVGIKFGGKKK